MLWACGPAAELRSGENVGLSIVPDLSVPSANRLARKLEDTLGLAWAGKAYVRKDGTLLDMEAPRARRSISAVVRSSDERTGLAYVDLQEHRDYRMPVFQIRHFDGKEWSAGFDRGIFIGSAPGASR